MLVDVDLPHSGGDRKIYIVKSLFELHKLLAEQTWPEIHVAIYRERQYPFRGVVDETFITQAMGSIADGQHYAIVKLRDYPTPCEWLDDGKSHEQLGEQLKRLKGESVGIGTEPFEAVDRRAQDSHKSVFSLLVSKNQNYYEPYAKTPKRYTRIVKEWDSTG